AQAQRKLQADYRRTEQQLQQLKSSLQTLQVNNSLSSQIASVGARLEAVTKQAEDLQAVLKAAGNPQTPQGLQQLKQLEKLTREQVALQRQYNRLNVQAGEQAAANTG